MTSPFELTPVAHVRGGRTEAIDDNWGASRATIALDPARFGPDALAGLANFSHLEVIFVFDKVPPEKIEYGARHPRGRQDWPLVGIFAQRGKNRPNRLGLCTCRIIGVQGLTVEVEGIDAIDGTPVLDLKPVMRAFLPRGEVLEPQWAGELMRDYW
ncbi:SAM-dependent methyltransferase [Novosphingobium sp.]|uniref:SAM-dependent methyltransferase n=1 Tax=Novosphingobium sp. TaxID=1874826 RepID=UPI0025ECF2C9|nr:SAM-dependent methyltransferase [Novosphingobium sp.]